jgi:hypothetical protein
MKKYGIVDKAVRSLTAIAFITLYFNNVTGTMV